jgi:glycosyltransferase involved in cell wall biosynthesis
MLTGESCKKPIKVLFLGVVDSPGGVNAYVNSIVKGVGEAEFEFHALCRVSESSRWISNRIATHEFEVNYGAFNIINRLISLVHLLSKIDPDVIHCHTARAGFLGALVKTILAKPMVYSGHSWVFEQKRNFILRGFYKYLEGFIAKRADIITFLTRRDLEFGVQNKLVEINRSISVNTRIDDFQLLCSDERRKKQVKLARAPLVINIGEVCDRKDPMLFIEIAKRVICVRPEVKFEWIGEGVLRRDALDEIHKYALSDNIKFMGSEDNFKVRSKILEAHLMLFTSHFEGVPLVILEAKLGNLPIVANSYPGVESVVRNGIDGITFAPSNAQEGAEYVLDLLKNSTAYEKFMKAGREYAILNHSKPEIMAAEFSDIYHKLVGSINNKDV